MMLDLQPHSASTMRIARESANAADLSYATARRQVSEDDIAVVRESLSLPPTAEQKDAL